ncbi:MAG: hypothetical protein M1839_000762 [Geoglossum umbratile]|nr:MAG: hypothetical protein M1839_000762 [Geoglossum umbratile]
MDRSALDAREATLRGEHPDTLTSANNLGSVLPRQGKYKEAEAMHRRALEGHEKVLGPEHPSTLTSAGNLGSALERQGKYKEAEAMHRRALETREKVLEPEHPSTLTSAGNLGSALERQSKLTLKGEDEEDEVVLMEITDNGKGEDGVIIEGSTVADNENAVIFGAKDNKDGAVIPGTEDGEDSEDDIVIFKGKLLI